jgi:hypothetical protein
MSPARLERSTRKSTTRRAGNIYGAPPVWPAGIGIDSPSLVLSQYGNLRTTLDESSYRLSAITPLQVKPDVELPIVASEPHIFMSLAQFAPPAITGRLCGGRAAHNIIAIPLAAGVLARAGILLSPAIGAVLMSISTVIVAANAQLLRRARL